MKTTVGSIATIFGLTLTSRIQSSFSFSPIIITHSNVITPLPGTNVRKGTTRSLQRMPSTRLSAMGKSASKTTKNKNHSNSKSSVAIIGGGIAGLSCAQHLQTHYDVTVYDTGRLRPGGRASSRQPGDKPKVDAQSADYPLLSKFRFDHAAQFIVVKTKALAPSWRTDFDQQVQDWIDRGTLQVAPTNSMYLFERKTDQWKANCLNPELSSTEPEQRFCYPKGGMSSLVDVLVTGGTFDIEQDVWVSPSSGVRYQGPPAPQGSNSKDGVSKESWTVRANGQVLGKHDHLIVAHNGKCADRLMSKTPARDVHRLLRTNFNDRVPGNGGQKMTLNSIYSLTFCIKGPSALSRKLPEKFVGGFVQDHPRLGVVTSQTNKYPTTSYKDDDEDVEVWTILSTASFAKKNKAPQEFLPDDVVHNVTRLLVDSLESDILGSTASLHDQILESRLQLWGAAVPLNVWRGDSDDPNESPGFLHDPRYQVGVCGDWLLEASIAGAWTSGRKLAQHLIKAEHKSKAKYVGFSKGQFGASTSVRRLGLASLDGPMNKGGSFRDEKGSSKHLHPKNKGGRGRNNNENNKTNNRRRSNQQRNRNENTQKNKKTSTSA